MGWRFCKYAPPPIKNSGCRIYYQSWSYDRKMWTKLEIQITVAFSFGFTPWFFFSQPRQLSSSTRAMPYLPWSIYSPDLPLEFSIVILNFHRKKFFFQLKKSEWLTYSIFFFFRILIAEAWGTEKQVKEYYGNSTHPGVHFPFNFEFALQWDYLSPDSFRQIINKWFRMTPNGVAYNWLVSIF